MRVVHRFRLADSTKEILQGLPKRFGYNGFGETIFYRTYSREIYKRYSNGDLTDTKKPVVIGQENWSDVVIRVTEGTFSIRKDWYLKTGVIWDEEYWQEYAIDFAISMHQMHWMPPGRGLWAMGTDFIYERGSMALYNCSYASITDNYEDDLAWMMDALMCGCGVGFGPQRNDKMELKIPHGRYDFVIPDTREGWCDALKAILLAYKLGGPKPRFIYDLIRKKGEPIKGFGGMASGPEPLIELLEQHVPYACNSLNTKKEYDSVRFKVDLANWVGCCVVAGNTRRSAELACASINDETFLDLKNYEKHPERRAHGWLSNNSVILESDEDFERLGEIAKRVVTRGEPGYINMQNLRYGRLGRKDKMRRDRAVGFNPCGEIPLEDREVNSYCL